MEKKEGQGREILGTGRRKRARDRQRAGEKARGEGGRKRYGRFTLPPSMNWNPTTCFFGTGSSRMSFNRVSAPR